jgi:rhodanese-related sulfurtransferase
LITLAFIAFIIGASQIFITSHEQHIEKINSIEDFSNYKFDEITSDELALRLLYNDRSIRFIDVRSEDEFKKFALPNAILADYKLFIERRWEDIFRVKGQTTVIYAEDEETEKRAVLAAKDVGFENISILRGGLKQFRKDILNFQMPEGPIEKSMKDKYRFRQTAAAKLPKIIEEAKPKEVVKTKPKRVLGGC